MTKSDIFFRSLGFLLIGLAIGHSMGNRKWSNYEKCLISLQKERGMNLLFAVDFSDCYKLVKKDE